MQRLSVQQRVVIVERLVVHGVEQDSALEILRLFVVRLNRLGLRGRAAPQEATSLRRCVVFLDCVAVLRLMRACEVQRRR